MSSLEICQYIEKAKTEIEAQRVFSAVQLLMQAHIQAPNNLEILTKLAHCYFLTKNFNLCYPLYTKISQEGSLQQKSEACYGLGNLNFEVKNYLLAEYFYQTLLSLNSEFEMVSSVYLRLGIIYKKRGEYQKSLSNLNTSFQYKDFSPFQMNEFLLQLANTLELMNNLKSATELYVEAAKLNKNCRNLVCLAWIFIKTKKFEKAESLLSKAGKKSVIYSKEWYDVQLVSAVCYYKNKKYKGCEEVLNEIERVYPNEPLYCAFFAAFKGFMGKKEKVAEYLMRNLRVFMNRTDFQQMLDVMSENSQNNAMLIEIDKLITDITEFPFNMQYLNYTENIFRIFASFESNTESCK